MTETTFTARFFNEDGGRSEQTIAPYKDLLINTMKHLLLIFDDWDGFEIETNGKTIYKYLKDYGNKRKCIRDISNKISKDNCTADKIFCNRMLQRESGA